MRKVGLLAAVVTGLSAVSLQIGSSANVQTQTQRPSAVSGIRSPKRTIELRLLSPDGKTIAHFFTNVENVGKGLVMDYAFANIQRISSVQNKSTDPVIYRFEGKGVVKIRRNGSETTLLQTERDDAVVECTISKTKPAAPTTFTP